MNWGILINTQITRYTQDTIKPIGDAAQSLPTNKANISIVHIFCSNKLAVIAIDGGTASKEIPDELLAQ